MSPNGSLTSVVSAAEHQRQFVGNCGPIGWELGQPEVEADTPCYLGVCPGFVEVAKQALLLIMLCGVGLRFSPVRDELLEGVSDKPSPEDRELLVGFQAAEAFSRFHHSSGSAIAAFRHRFTLRQTRRTLPMMFSIELVQASERRSFAGTPRRVTVSISSSPHSNIPSSADRRSTTR